MILTLNLWQKQKLRSVRTPCFRKSLFCFPQLLPSLPLGGHCSQQHFGISWCLGDIGTEMWNWPLFDWRGLESKNFCSLCPSNSARLLMHTCKKKVEHWAESHHFESICIEVGIFLGLSVCVCNVKYLVNILILCPLTLIIHLLIPGVWLFTFGCSVYTIMLSANYDSCSSFPILLPCFFPLIITLARTFSTILWKLILLLLDLYGNILICYH